MMDQEEKDRKRKAWITTGSIQLALLLLLYLLVAWQTPNSPNPEFGIELNFGEVSSGSGSRPVVSPIPTETVEEETEVAQESAEVESNDTAESEVIQDDLIETVENVNADVVQEEIVEASSEKAETNDGTEEENTSEATDQPDEEINESQGETGETGDQGDPEGDINENALYYGTQGGGDDGSSLQMSGWEWDAPPKPDDTTEEAGRIVYEIEVDSDGYLKGYKVITSTMSPAIIQKYTLAIQDLTFSKTSSYKPAQTSKGRITFIIRAR